MDAGAGMGLASGVQSLCILRGRARLGDIRGSTGTHLGNGEQHSAQALRHAAEWDRLVQRKL